MEATVGGSTMAFKYEAPNAPFSFKRDYCWQRHLWLFPGRHDKK